MACQAKRSAKRKKEFVGPDQKNCTSREKQRRLKKEVFYILETVNLNQSQSKVPHNLGGKRNGSYPLHREKSQQ